MSYAGYMHLENDNKAQIFFWFFENPVRESPIIVWFNGGPVSHCDPVEYSQNCIDICTLGLFITSRCVR